MSGDAKKKVLLIDSSIAFTGALNSALDQSEQLSNQFEFVFVLPRKCTDRDKIKDAGIKIYTIPIIEISRSIFKDLIYLPVLIMNSYRLNKIVKKEKIEIIQVNDFYNLLGVMMKITGFRGKLITIVRFLPSSLPAILTKIWIRLAQRYSYKVICVSDAVLKQLPKKENIVRIYHAISLEEKYDENFFQKHDKIKLLYLANYIPGKGQGYAIEAFALAYKQNPDLRLKFMGGDMGLKKNKRKKRRLIARAVELKISAAVEFSGFSDEIEKAIKESDMVLNFSESESFSMTCAEASYFGKPVIATRCGGPEEIILHGKTGLLVKNRNIEEMTAAILQLAGDEEKRKQFGSLGRQYIREKFSVQEFAESMSQIFALQALNIFL